MAAAVGRLPAPLRPLLAYAGPRLETPAAPVRSQPRCVLRQRAVWSTSCRGAPRPPPVWLQGTTSPPSVAARSMPIPPGTLPLPLPPPGVICTDTNDPLGARCGLCAAVCHPDAGVWTICDLSEGVHIILNPSEPYNAHGARSIVSSPDCCCVRNHSTQHTAYSHQTRLRHGQISCASELMHHDSRASLRCQRRWHVRHQDYACRELKDTLEARDVPALRLQLTTAAAAATPRPSPSAAGANPDTPMAPAPPAAARSAAQQPRSYSVELSPAAVVRHAVSCCAVLCAACCASSTSTCRN